MTKHSKLQNSRDTGQCTQHHVIRWSPPRFPRWSHPLHTLIACCVVISAPFPVRSQSPLTSVVTGPETSSSTQKPQDPRVTLTLRNIPRDQALQQIAQQTGLAISWSQAQVPLTGTVSATLRDVPFQQALAIILQGTGAQAKLSADGRKIVIVRDETRPSSSKSETTGIVTGQILDSATGTGIEGATVTVLGTRLSTVTQQKGEFRIAKVPTGPQRLLVKLFGYKSAERAVDVQTNAQVALKIVLVSVPTTLSGVVTTATGLQRRLEVSTDVTRLDVDSIMATAPIKSVTDLLATRVPGLQVLRTSGTPGDPSRLRLRGAGSINGSNAPIVIVDGVRMYSPDGSTNGATSVLLNGSGSGAYAAPSPLDGLDPNTIETIEVLKGPSASSLYGSDAANGVIVITTKRGAPGVTRTNVAVTAGTSAIPDNFRENLFRFGHLFNGESTICDFYQPCVLDSLVSFQAMNDARYSPLTRASTGSVSGTISGGSQAFLFSFTGSASQQNGLSRLPGALAGAYQRIMGTTPPSWMRRPEGYWRLNGSNSSTMILSPALTIAMSHLVNVDEQRRSSLGTLAAGQLLKKYIDISTADLPSTTALLTSYQERVKSSRLFSQHTMSVAWQVRPTIPFKLQAGINPSSTKGTIFLPAGIPANLLGSSDTTGHFSSDQSNTLMTTIAGNTTVPVTLANGASVALALGGDFTRQDERRQSFQMLNVPVGVTEPTNANLDVSVVNSNMSTATYGLFFEPRLTIASRLFVQSGLRFDGGSASGDRAGLTKYPKIGVSWAVIDNVSDVTSGTFWPDWISQLKLRSGFGQAGVQPGPNQDFRLLNVTSGSVDGGQTVGTRYGMNALGNTRLRPERSSEFEGGADMELFGQQRLSLSANVYRKHQRDAIMERSVAPSAGAGYTTQTVNIGNILNTGYELQINSRLLDVRSTQWTMGVLLSHRTNRLTKKSDDVWVNEFEATRLVVGYPVFGYWARPLKGFSDPDSNGLQASDVKLGDSAVYLGASDPKYSATFNTTLSLLNGRLTASASVDYQHAATQYNHNGRNALISIANAANASLLDQAVAYTVLNTFSGANAIQSPYYLIQSVNTLRFQSLSIGYTLPGVITRALRANYATVAIQGNNLGLRTGYRGLDPNVNAYSSGNLSADYGQLPQPREWVLRFNVSR